MGRKDKRQKRHQQKKADVKQKKDIAKKQMQKDEVVKHNPFSFISDELKKNNTSDMKFISHFYPKSWLSTLSSKIPAERIQNILKTYFTIVVYSKDIQYIKDISPDILGIELVNYHPKKQSNLLFPTKFYLDELIKNDYSPNLDDFIIHILNTYYKSEYGIKLLKNFIDLLLSVCSLYMLKSLQKLILDFEISYVINIDNRHLIQNDNIEVLNYISSTIGIEKGNVYNILQYFTDRHSSRSKRNINTILNFLIQQFKLHTKLEQDVFEGNKDEEYKNRSDLSSLSFLICRYGDPVHLEYLLTKVELNELSSLGMDNILYLAKHYPIQMRNYMFSEPNGNFLFDSIYIKLEQLELLLSHLNLTMDFIIENKYYTPRCGEDYKVIDENFVVSERDSKISGVSNAENFTISDTGDSISNISEEKTLSEDQLKYEIRHSMLSKKNIFHFLASNMNEKCSENRIVLVEQIIKKYFLSDTTGEKNNNEENVDKFRIYVTSALYYTVHNEEYYEHLYSRLVCTHNVKTKTYIENIMIVLGDITDEQRNNILKHFYFNGQGELIYFYLTDLIKCLCSNVNYWKSTTSNREYQIEVFHFISRLYDDFYDRALLEMDGLEYSFYVAVPKIKKLYKDIKGPYSKPWTLTKSLFSEDDNINNEKYRYHEVNPKSYAKKFSRNLLKLIMKYGNLQLYEYFSDKITLPYDCSDLFKQNKNIEVVEKYVLFEYDNYEKIKKKISKELNKYSNHITYKFKDNKVDILSIVRDMSNVDVYEYGYASKVERKINHPLVVKLLTSYTEKFFNETDESLSEYDLYNLLFEELPDILILLSEICSKVINGPKERNNYRNEKNTIYFQTLIKVCFRLRNSEYIRYLKKTYPEQFKLYMKVKFLYYNYDIELLKELEHEGYLEVNNEFIMDYLGNMPTSILKKEYYTKEIDENDLIKFLDYLINEVGYDDYEEHIKTILKHEMSPTSYSGLTSLYHKLMNYLYLTVLK